MLCNITLQPLDGSNLTLNYLTQVSESVELVFCFSNFAELKFFFIFLTQEVTATTAALQKAIKKIKLLRFFQTTEKGYLLYLVS